MPTRNARLCPAIVVLLAAWTLFQEMPTSFLGGTQRKFRPSSEIPRQSDEYRNPADHVTQKTAPSSHSSRNPKSKLANLVAFALGRTLTKDDIVYLNQKLDYVRIPILTESTVRLPILTEWQPREYKATAETATEAEKAVALVAIRELEACLLAMGDARRAKKDAKKVDTAPSSDARPKTQLKQLLSHALGINVGNKEQGIIYTDQVLGEIIEVTVTLPLLKDMEQPTEFKATSQLAEGVELARDAAARLAFQELEPSLMAKAKTRMAQEKGNNS